MKETTVNARTDAKQLTDVQLNVLRELAAGGMVTLDAHNFPRLSGRDLSTQTLWTLQDLRLVKVLEPSRKTTTMGNGYVLSDKGRAALESQSAQLKKLATAGQRRQAAEMGLSFPDDTTREELHELISENRRNREADGARATARWFVLSVWRELHGDTPAASPDLIETLAGEILTDPRLAASVKKYLPTGDLWVSGAAALIQFGDGYGGTGSKRTLAFRALAERVRNVEGEP